MPNYRRNRVPGGTFFFTVNLYDRTRDLLTRHIQALRDSVQLARQRAPFHIDAWVVLPDHMHCMWTLPPGDAQFPARWQRIKATFSASLPAEGTPSPALAKRGYRGIWQRGYWEHTIRDERDYNVHMDYIHFNPVKHGLVAGPADWPYSTFRRSVARGVYPLGWGGADVSIEAGERAEG